MNTETSLVKCHHYQIGDYNVPKATKMYQEKAGIKVVTEIQVKKLLRVMKMK